MKSRGFILSLILPIVVIKAAAQDPFKVAPSAYKLQFENDWVRVARVHYGPKETPVTRRPGSCESSLKLDL